MWVMALLICTNTVVGQERYDTIRTNLDSLSDVIDGLNQVIDISVSDVSLQEFVRAIAINNKVNITIDPAINTHVFNNFSGVTAKEVLLFLCRYYGLDLVFSGTIISIVKYEAPPVIHDKKQPKKPKIFWNGVDSLMGCDLRDDSLLTVARVITGLTGRNIIIDPQLHSVKVYGYFRGLGVEALLKELALANHIALAYTDQGSLFLYKDSELKKVNSLSLLTVSSNIMEEGFAFSFRDSHDITLHARQVSISELLIYIFSQIDIGYFFHTLPQGHTTLYVHGVSLEELVSNILASTTCSYNIQNGIYIIGDNRDDVFMEVRLLSLSHRSVVDVSPLIPERLRQGMEIKEFVEMNTIIVSGPRDRVTSIASFVESIDKVVPLILIEVLIIDQKKSYALSTGISAGLAEGVVTESGGQILPGIDMQFTAATINKLLNSFNGLGIFNLGKVMPDFYVTLQAMEDQGILKMRSTPQLAAMNGYEAKMTIGNTEYYIEENNHYVGDLNPVLSTTRTFKPVNADFSLIIIPQVSDSEQITLSITVEQSNFTSRISNDAPPGKETRSFSSSLRVKNGEMVLLGGLERKSINESGSGLPVLSRIPVLKWFFSSRKRENSKSKLSIFIKPTVIY